MKKNKLVKNSWRFEQKQIENVKKLKRTPAFKYLTETAIARYLLDLGLKNIN